MTGRTRAFVGGVRAGWGLTETWPLVRLTLTKTGGTIAPSALFLRFFLPTFTFDWTQVHSVDFDSFRGGIRFRFRARLPGRHRWGPGAWLYARPRQLTFVYRNRDWNAIYAAIPTEFWSKPE
jgi:hypothetical protein